jgi:predicted RNase H-like nuclease (RuvC/YqgF family)
MGRSLAELAIQARTPLFMINRKPVYPIMGGAEDGESEEEEKSGSESSEDEDHSEDEDKAKDPRIKELSDENARRRNEAKRLADELAKAQARLKEIDDADKSATERLEGKISDLEKQNEALLAANKELSIKNAFLADKKHAWRNPDSALKLLDLSEVDIDDDGKISGLDKAIKKLADSDSYLLEPTDENTGLPPRQASGDRTKQQPKDKATKSREDLIKRFPALQR